MWAINNKSEIPSSIDLTKTKPPPRGNHLYHQNIFYLHFFSLAKTNISWEINNKSGILSSIDLTKTKPPPRWNHL